MKMYKMDEIQKVYKQHADKPGSVIYSDDDGKHWQSVPLITGKWHINIWEFAFIK